MTFLDAIAAKASLLNNGPAFVWMQQHENDTTVLSQARSRGEEDLTVGDIVKRLTSQENRLIALAYLEGSENPDHLLPVPRKAPGEYHNSQFYRSQELTHAATAFSAEIGRAETRFGLNIPIDKEPDPADAIIKTIREMLVEAKLHIGHPAEQKVHAR